MIFNFEVTLSSGDSFPKAYTYPGLGSDKNGNTIPTLSIIPYVGVESEGNLNVRAVNRTTTGFSLDIGLLGDPPDNTTVQLLVVTFDGASASLLTSDFGTLRKEIKSTHFKIPNSDGTGFVFNNLYCDLAEIRMPDKLIKSILNRAMMDINKEILDVAETYSDTMTADDDKYKLPSDLFMIRKIIVFESASDKKGFPLEQVTSYDALIRRGTDLTGMPERFLVGTRTASGDSAPTKYIQWDRTPDSAYAIEIHYWQLPPSVDVEADVPEIFPGYNTLIIDKVCMEIAKKLGDRERFLEFRSENEMNIRKAKDLEQQVNTPLTSTQFNDLSIPGHKWGDPNERYDNDLD